MYCVKCGAELDEGVEKCPLCETPVLKTTDEENVIYDPEYPIININLYELKISGIFIVFHNINNIHTGSFFSKYDCIWRNEMGILRYSFYSDFRFDAFCAA